MGRRRKVQFAVTSLLGLGIALGSFTTKVAAEDIEVIGGTTKQQDIIGGEDEYGWVSVREASTWEGNMKVATGGFGTVELEGQSQWKGNLTVDSGSSSVSILDSAWTGNLQIENNSPLMSENVVHMERSQWTGNFEAKNSDVVVHADDHSLYTGNISVAEGEGNVSLQNNSVWKGNLKGSAEQADQYIGVELCQNSLWEGDALISNSIVDGLATFNVDICGESEWKGNLEMDSGDTSASTAWIEVQNSSSWIGNADVKEGSIYAQISNSSKWNGNLSLQSLNEVQDYSGANIYIETNSSWRGDLYVHRVGAPCVCGTTIDVAVIENSEWLGNATLSGSTFLNASVMNHSTWIGDVDFTQTKMNPQESDSVGMIGLCGNSLWEGKIISNKNIADVGVTNSTWRMTDSSETHHFFAEDSTISFIKNPGKFSTLSVQECASIDNTLFLMNTDLAANQGDLLKVNGPLFGHNNKIEVNNQGSAWVNAEQELTIVETGGSASDAFSLTRPSGSWGF